jgi:serine/threonine-protein kinase
VAEIPQEFAVTGPTAGPPPKNEFEIEAGVELDRYELLLPIARGGMGQVWAARLRGTRGFQKLVAIKTILASTSEDHHFEQMLLEEAKLASQIQHANVAQCFDLGEQHGTLYLVMEWVDGEPLDVLIKRAAPLAGVPLSVALEIVHQACRGLHAAHELKDSTGSALGLVHRDVSPQNLMITYAGAVKLVDFGIAKATQLAPAVSHGGEIKGKLSYMSPEQARGHAVDRRTDVFALGVVLYVLTTGRHPFRGATPVETLRRICSNAPVDRPSSFVVGYPPALEEVVMRAIAHDKEDRFETAADLAEALRHSGAPLATEHQLGLFVRSLCGERSSDRHLAIRDALRTADERSEAQRRERSDGVLREPTGGQRREPAGEGGGEFSSLRAISLRNEAGREKTPATADIPFRSHSRWRGVAAAALLLLGLVTGIARPWEANTSAPAAEPIASSRGALPRAEASPVPSTPAPTPVVSAAAAAPPPAATSATPPPATSAQRSPTPTKRRPAVPEVVAPAAPVSVAPAAAPAPASAKDPLDRRK